MKLCVDLCSGLGGFSSAFMDSPDWEVITVDIEPRFKPIFLADVRTLKASEIEKQTRLGSFGRYEKVLIVASPPCNHYSTAGLVNGWPRKGIRASLDIIGAIFEIVAEIRESIGEKHAWIMENPTSIISKFMPKPMMKIRLSDYGSPFKKPTYLWGNVRLPMVLAIGDWVKAPRERYFNRLQRTGIMGLKSSEERAKLPFGLSQAVLQAVESK